MIGKFNFYGGIFVKKKIFLICLILLFCFILVSCTEQTPDDPSGDDSSGQASTELGVAADYYPICENVEYVYEGTGNEFAFYNVFIDYTSETEFQRRINNGGTEVVEVIEIAEGTVTCVYKEQEVFYRENFLSKESNTQEILLMDPIETGTTWETSNGETRLGCTSSDRYTCANLYTSACFCRAKTDNHTTSD